MKTKLYCTILDETFSLGFSEICSLCHVEDSFIHEMVDEGVLVPEGNSPEKWRFNGYSVKKVQITLRLQSDLGVNLPGAALALELLEELDDLRSQLNKLS